MALSKYRIGELVEPFSQACGIPNLTKMDVSGVNKEKEFFEPSNQVGEDTSKYKIVPPNYFACNLMHVGRDEVLPIALNRTKKNKIVSPAYTVFKIREGAPISKEFFFIMIKSPERDRFFWFNTDSSIRDGLDWGIFCDIEVELPDVPTQKKYVEVYEALFSMRGHYQHSREDLKLTCDAFIERMMKKLPRERLGDLIEEVDERNRGRFGTDSVRGIATQKKFIDTKADLRGVEIDNYKVVQPRTFAYVADTSRRGDKVSLALNNSDEPYLVSSITTTFRIRKDRRLLPEYLALFFLRSEFDRYARYHSWGSARETFEWDALGEMEIPVPDITVQQAIVDISRVYQKRNDLQTRVEDITSKICPILFRGATKEEERA